MDGNMVVHALTSSGGGVWFGRAAVAC